MSQEAIKALYWAGITLLLVAIVNRLSNKMFKKTQKLHIKFFGNLAQAILIITSIVFILNLFPAYQKFSESILTSSSLLVVVLGFAFQTSLSDVIAGIFISIFKPFEVNNRVTLKTMEITGVVESISIRHTIIRTFVNSRIVIPNHIANEEIIENKHFQDSRAANFIDVSISYESNLGMAKQIIARCIEQHKDTINPDDNGKKSGYTTVYTREFQDSGIALRASAWTKDVDQNFKACSDIREDILREFKKHHIEIPYPHTQIVQEKH